MKAVNLFIENVRVAFQAIRTNQLRAILTVFIIAFGIMALVGILTAIESIKSAMTEQFTFMGANTFSIESRGMTVVVGNQRHRTRNYSYISYRQAREFKERYTFPGSVSVSVYASGSATVKYRNNKSNPIISVRGVDENYLETAGYELERGRNFTPQEIQQNRHLVIIGADLVPVLFKNNEDPIDKIISVGPGKYKIIGVLKGKGMSFGGMDQVCMLPHTNVRQYYSRPNMSYTIQVKPHDSKYLDVSISEAEGIFRIVRGLKAMDESDFNITKSDNLLNILLENIKVITYAATVIGLITLFGAAIGLMNIMLVSVTERTREIGIRKAIGAKASFIKQQFLFEAVVIGQLGGLVGIVLGIIIGNLVSALMDASFIVPWIWIINGVIACFVVGVGSGYLPAVKASRLDPIVALRYE
ncbi:MAG TPA: FtsX-like permease family protein [Bacteroidetes bacterium]|nr:FtsX-like permease family protein [Bacteroidota bacterium]